MNTERSGRTLGLMLEAIGKAVRTHERVEFIDHDMSECTPITFYMDKIKQLADTLEISLGYTVENGKTYLKSYFSSPKSPDKVVGELSQQAQDVINNTKYAKSPLGLFMKKACVYLSSGSYSNFLYDTHIIEEGTMYFYKKDGELSGMVNLKEISTIHIDTLEEQQ